MKIIKVFGGLGNQIFQYTFYEYIKQWDKNAKLDISDFRVHKYHNGFELDKVFELTFDEASDEEIKNLSFDQKKIFYRLMRKMGFEVYKQSQFEERINNIIVGEGSVNRDLYFTGYWQSSYYPMNVESKLRSSLNFKRELNKTNKDILREIESNNSVSIHIRRGDYINSSTLAGICNESYYENAIKYVECHVTTPQFYVFSDDLDWVKANITIPGTPVFVDWNRGTDSCFDMQLMASCKHNIIANSTFSWWGAWLNMHDDKIVIMPRRWYNGQEANPLFCTGWIKL